MRGVTVMGGLRRGRRAGIGVAAAALAAITATGYATGTAAAAPAAKAQPAHLTAQTTPAYKPSARTLKEGMSGADVKALQERLATLKYYPGSIDGTFAGDTLEAVWAFQEVNGLSVDGVVGPATKRALVNPRAFRSNDPRQDGTRIEVNLNLRVLALYVNHKIALLSHVSSGGGYYYCSSGGCAYAITPTGNYRTTVYMPGWVTVPLGEMYNPVFFISTVYAIHGDTDVPVNPVSHGCIRIPMDIAAFFHNMVKTPGTEVFVYR
jgi:peptidoglycan hydrolase-like protein with peptidoglycan-binding domain